MNIVSEARPSGLQSGETYTYQLWANANNQYYFSGKASFTIQDNTNPVISDVKISNLTSEGYTAVSYTHLAALMLTEASGALVPMATIVRPMMTLGILRNLASEELPSTKKSAPLINNTKPIISNRYSI